VLSVWSCSSGSARAAAAGVVGRTRSAAVRRARTASTVTAFGWLDWLSTVPSVYGRTCRQYSSSTRAAR
jgi:hypothetical protein